MKGTILKSIKDLVVSTAGNEVWNEIIKTSGFEPNYLIRSTADIDDSIILNVIKNIEHKLNLTHDQLAELFGDYWVNEFAPRIYGAYYLGMKSAKDMLLKMDTIHERVTRDMENSKPPRFAYKWKDDKTLIIDYKSQRNLIDLFIGLIKGVGKHFNEVLKINKLSDQQVEVVFP